MKIWKNLMLLRHLLIAMLVLTSSPIRASDSVLLAAGAGYRKPVLELLANFSQASGIRAEASFGNMVCVLGRAGSGMTR